MHSRHRLVPDFSARQLRSCALRPAAMAAALALAAMGLAQASTSGVVISQVYGGGGNGGSVWKNDFIELFNAGSAPVSLSGWSVQYASAAGTSWSTTALGNVTLQPGQYYLVQEALGAGGTTALPTPDAVGTLTLSGTAGKVALVSSTAALASTATASSSNVVDFVGFGGTATLFEGSAPTAAPSNTTAVLRAANGCTDNNQNASDFATGTPAPRNTSTTLNVCGGAGTGTGGGTGSGGDTGTLVSIASIQGTGPTSPLLGQSVVTQGVVTKVNNNGFFMQSQVEDGNPATSDGIFVFTSTAPTVSAGQLVQVSATVVEFNTGASTNALTAAHTVTELSAPSVTVQGSGFSVTPTVLNFPATEAQLEAVEGMLVQINQQLTASQNYFQGRYGQVTLSAGGRLIKPTNVFAAGTADAIALATSNAQRQILLDDGTSAQNVNPTPYFAADHTLRAGDTLDSLVGVVDYGLSTSSTAGLASYKVHPTQPVTFTRANARTNAPAAVGNSNVKVASFNVLNYFTTFGNGATASGQTGQGCSMGGAVAAANCRGADNLYEFNRQRDKIVRAISALNADVVGLMEIQNNGNTAVQNLVDGLNAHVGAGTYAAVAVPTPISGGGAGTGSDAIRVAMIYKPAKLSLSGSAVSDTDAIHNRPPLAQTFSAANGEKFTVVVNHFKSKGSCPASGDADLAGNADVGDGQGCWNGRRTAQATQLRNFIGALQTARGDGDVLVIGDLNAYGKEDPVLNLSSHGFTDLLEAHAGSSDYSYVFDGEAGYLDHALASASLRNQVTGAAHWHINADEPSVIDYNEEFKLSASGACAYSACSPDHYTASPFRASDHDPVVIGLRLVKAINGSVGNDNLVGTAGDDRITGGTGADTLTGNGGSDTFVYNSLRDALDVITDFTPGDDKLDLTALAGTLRANAGAGTNLLASGHIVLVDTANGLEVRVDSDGALGSGTARILVRLPGVTSGQFLAARDLLL